MTVKWTTVAIVKQYVKGCDTALSDAEVSNFIEMNEGYIETLLKIPASFTFNASLKPHLAIRKLVSILTALDIMSSTPQSYQTFTAIDATSKLLVAQYDEMIREINKPAFIDYIKNVEA